MPVQVSIFKFEKGMMRLNFTGEGNMTSRERVKMAINHQQPDRVPIDIGGTNVTGMHGYLMNEVRDALGLEKKTIEIFNPMLFLGTVEEDLRLALGGDVIGLFGRGTNFGFRNTEWKNWKAPNGMDFRIGKGFEASTDKDGRIYAYPNGNRTVAPSALMLPDGAYFEPIARQKDLSDHDFNGRVDYADQVDLTDDDELRYFEETSKKYYEETDYSIVGNCVKGLGDALLLPAPWLEKPKGIRELTDWMMALYDHPDYIKDAFAVQTEMAIKNLELYHQAVGDRIDIVTVGGTDFGQQNGLFLSRDSYREFYKPFHKEVNDWIHKNTSWKTFVHSCGSVVDLIEDFIEAGMDILNPVQISAKGMKPENLKEKFAGRIVFWGGGVDSQKTLPFGTAAEVEEETKSNVKILSEGGGFVCAGIHNLQYGIPSDNLIAFFNSVNS